MAKANSRRKTSKKGGPAQARPAEPVSAAIFGEASRQDLERKLTIGTRTAAQARELADLHAEAYLLDQLAADIGRRLVEAREGLGFSQHAVANRSKGADPAGLGISRSTLSLYETGVNKPGARELMVLCEVLHVTPNWLLYGSDSPAKTLQASLEFQHGSELAMALRMAFAIFALEPHERDAYRTIILASAEKKLGDIGLSALISLAQLAEKDLLATIIESVGEEKRDQPIGELLKLFVASAGSADGFYTNRGTLRPNVKDDDYDPFEDGVLPPRRLSKK